MVTLMESLESEEIGNGARSGSAALGLPSNGRGVVRKGGNGAFAQVEEANSNVVASNSAGQLKIGVGDSAGRVVPGDHRLGNVGRERSTPETGCVGVLEDNATHAGGSCIGSLYHRGLTREEFGDASGT